MAPKNKKKNSFYFFMKEMKEKEAAKGRNISIQDMPQIAHPIWKKLSLAEREPYEEMARRYKNDPNLRGGKLASDGTRVEDNLREEEELKLKENQMKQEIKRYCNIDCVSDEQFKEYASRKLIYFLSFNILCHTEDDVYVPIEIGLIEYSIQHGIHREYHKILLPGRIPTGYAFAAKHLSEEKHQIDIYSTEGKEKDMKIVYNDIKMFTNPQKSDEFPPVFCLDSDIELTEGCLKCLANCARTTNVFRVWNSTYLLMELRAGVGQPFPSLTIACDLLHKTSFDYHPSARCKFHEEVDVHYCALAYSKRLCYLFSDAVCLLFDVPLTENHIPTRAVEDKEYSVSTVKDSPDFAFPASVRNSNSFQFDKRTNYYQNAESDEDEEEEDIQFPNSNSVSVPAQGAMPRQPASTCLAEEMTRLRLNITAATVPGHGIGRGQRRN